VTPGAEFEYESNILSAATGFDEADVASGMLGAVCQRLGEELIERLTGQAPSVPVPADFQQQVRDCEQSIARACVAVGTRLRDGVGMSADRPRALQYLEKGCNASGLGVGEACVDAAALLLEKPEKGDSLKAIDQRAKASVWLDRGCSQFHAPACTRRGELELAPYGDQPVSAYAIKEATLLFLRACDLGDAGACQRAARLYADAKSLARAAVLAERACAAGDSTACTDAKSWKRQASSEKTISGVSLATGDEVFDVRFGSWFELQKSEVAWIASRQDQDTVTRRVPFGRARVYDPTGLPHGPKAPAWARTPTACSPA
jgi:TPR repeat protein